MSKRLVLEDFSYASMSIKLEVVSQKSFSKEAHPL